MEIKEIIKLYNNAFGCVPSGVEMLPGAGSSRRYYRVFAPVRGGDVSASSSGSVPATVIACVGHNIVDNNAFISLAELFGGEDLHSDCGGVRLDDSGDEHITENHAVNVPRIYAVSQSREVYLQEDFGDTSLMDLILRERKGEYPSEKLNKLLRDALCSLVRMQTCDIEKVNKCVAYPPFSTRQVRWDLNYFKYEFLKPARVCFDESALEDDFERMEKDIADYPDEIKGFMYRDFQSRNIMIRNEDAPGSHGPGFIDFQGGMSGPAIYDVISFLWQAKAGFSHEMRGQLLDFYAKEYARVKGCDKTLITRHADLFALFRTLQVLGAYGFRGLVEKKSHFIESIPAAIGNLKWLLDNGVVARYPELSACCRALAEDPRWMRRPESGLTVSVFSFSYKKGSYPEDLSGNGGGFMFDCRAMHNPGRYAEYKKLTGDDTPVIEFLEERGEVQEFLKNIYPIVDKAVEVYLRRGFSNLQVGFGCTGGQHRSVYCARHAAVHIADKYPDARVVLLHREQMAHPVEISAGASENENDWQTDKKQINKG